jgi:drug/metabolite transporter (DMT)-like permease
MHFRLPKPLHGWREFAGEVGIIVIGVLIALGAEQFVGKIHQR